MASLNKSLMVENVLQYYSVIDGIVDTSIPSSFLMDSVLFPLATMVLYSTFVLKFGPKLMKNRKPFNIEYLIILYNVIQVLSNAFLFRRAIVYIWYHRQSMRCIRMEDPNTEIGQLMIKTAHMFVINKWMDLLDTVFFVLRKKQSHISFLHVYHHILTFSTTWVFAKFYPNGGQIIVLAMLNTLVHTFMYAYYLISLSDHLKSFSHALKKRITQIQLIQFFLGIIHATYGVTDPNCDYPKFIMYFGIVQALVMIYLFGNFYKKAYLSKSPKKIDHLTNGQVTNGKCIKKA